MKNSKLLTIFILMFVFATAFYFYPLVPQQMASHWNINGEVDGYMSSFWGLFLMPVLMLAFTLLLFFIPKIDPEKKNIEKFYDEFERFIVVFNLFMLYVYILTIFWNIGYNINMIASLMPAFAILFYFCGILIGKAKRNYMIGIRLPWTLASDDVWDKTHKIGEKLFKITALFVFLGTFFTQYAFALMFIPLIVSIVYLVIYSYLEYRKIKK